VKCPSWYGERNEENKMSDGMSSEWLELKPFSRLKRRTHP